jgi:hypothetical protein
MVFVKVEDFTDKMRCRLVCTDVYEEVSSFRAQTLRTELVRKSETTVVI